MQIADNTAVLFHYTLTNDAGDVIDSSRGREPLAYLHGAGTIVPGLEEAMAGHAEGDRFQVEVSPERGYGPRHEGMVQAVPRAAFQGVDRIEVGMQFQARGPQGVMSVTVTEVGDDQITVDANHPLAGQNLHFDIEVVSVRAATEEEIAHGHVHGPDAPHH
ncbi:MAG: peptidyl-prolyl cis-trans isomerase [Lysobacteraceae bacterium]|nr:MAG: peptidyl-prolyl cis-trans isomerase [Xanthomonadaceae bacterium]